MTLLADDPVSNLLDRLEGVKPTGSSKWQARCPAHEDRTASLSITRGTDSKAVLYCHAGCNREAILGKLGLVDRDLFPPKSSANSVASRRIVATYDYRNAENELVYQAIRYMPKDFRQRRPDGNGGWIFNMDGVTRILYRLPELLNAADDRPDDWVFVCEGEKDVDNLTAAGLIATCNVGGAGKWKPEYSELLRGRRVAVVADKDEPGRKHAAQVARSLTGIALATAVLELPGDGVKDASNWLNAGGTADELVSIADSAPAYDGAAPADSEELTFIPTFKSARQLLADHPHLRKPIIHGIQREGETMNVIAQSKVGKSWLVNDLLLSIVTGRPWLGHYMVERGDVLLMDNELHQETSADRLPRVAEALGLAAEQWVDHLFIENMRGKMADIFSLRPYFDSIKPGQFKVIVLDAFYRFVPRDTNENDNGTMTSMYNQIDLYAAQLGCGFILIHHSSKGSQADKSVTDVGSGAGAMSRAADAHLVLRPHEEDDVVVMDAAVRSFAPVAPVCLRWAFPKWTPDLLLDPSLLRKPTSRRRREPSTEQSEAPGISWTAETFIETFVSDKPVDKQTIIARASQAELSARKAESFIRVAIADGLIHRWAFPKDKTIYLADLQQPVGDSKGER